MEIMHESAVLSLMFFISDKWKGYSNLPEFKKFTFPTSMKKSLLSSPRDCLEIGASCVINFLLNGSARLSGILFVACLARYKAGREKTSLPFSVYFAMRNLASPIIGYLGVKFGSRTITLAGCLLASIGAGGCFFAQDIRVLVVFWGVFLGVGSGAGICLIPQILNQDFPNNFDRANGLFSSSASLGGFVLPILMNFLINTYGTSGSFLVLSAILLNTVPAAMILQFPNTKKRLTISTVNNYNVTHTFNLNKMESNFNEPPSNLRNEFKEDTEASATKSHISIDTDHSRNCSLVKQEQDTGEFVSVDSKIISGKIDPDESKVNKTFENIGCKREVTSKSFTVSSDSLKLQEGRTRASRAFLLFADPTYVLILLTQGMVPYIMTTLWTTIVDAAKDKGVVTDQQFYVLIGIYGAELLGRIASGYLRGTGCLSKVNVSASCFFCLGVTLPLFMCLDGLPMVMTAVLFYGLLIGSLMTVGIGIVQQYVEKDKLEMGFAAVYLFFGITSFTQPLLIGLFREHLQSYNGLFCVMGVMCLIFGILTMLIPKAARYRESNAIRCNLIRSDITRGI